MNRFKKAQLLTITTLSLVTLALILKKQKKKRKPRRWWVRPLLLQREEHGQYSNLFQFIKSNDGEQFFKYTRMSVRHFNELLGLLNEELSKKSIRRPLSPEHRLCISFYLAHGCSMQATAWSFYIAVSTASVIIRDTCRVIWNVLSPMYLATPKPQDWKKISEGFDTTWNMPNCIGAIDGKHIIIQAPRNSGSTFLNYKQSFSIVLMALCDSNYQFTLVDVGAFGSQHDAGVFRDSEFGVALENNTLGIPNASRLRGTNVDFPYYIVGDKAFPLKNYIMRPYPGSNLDKTKLIFNYRLSRARRTIENSFGILASRWRIFRSSIIASVPTAEAIVCAALCLHNYVMKEESRGRPEDALYCPNNYVDQWDEHGASIPGEWRHDSQSLVSQRVGRLGANNSTRHNRNLRDTLAEYLSSPEGAVTWQEAYVSRGST